MSTNNICFYKEVDKKYAGCNLKTKKLLDCAFIGVCVVISSNTVFGQTGTSKQCRPRSCHRMQQFASHPHEQGVKLTSSKFRSAVRK